MGEYIFVTMKSGDLDVIARELANDAIGREDYRRLCRWLIGLRSVMGMTRDTTLEVMETLEGGVNKAQKMLLKVAIKKCEGAIQQCTVEDEFINQWVAGMGRQLELF